jgi:5'-deoxynucleotidase YfbR-like HD superfamily hydrolase
MIREQIYATRYLAGKVKRYHTWPMLNQQTVGEHSARVANIYVEIYGMPRAEILYYCLNHDAGELWAGDVPFGIKRSLPELHDQMEIAEAQGLKMLDITLPTLTDEEKARVKICDLLEMWETGMYEEMMGNKFASPIRQDTLSKAQGMAANNDCSERVNKWLHQHWI